jgi:hypothetical protein
MEFQPGLYNPSTSGGSSPSIPTTVGSGTQTVTTAGTRVQLASSTAIVSVVVHANVDNQGYVYIGSSTVDATTGHKLTQGDAVSFDIDNLDVIYLDSDNDGDGVTYFWTK